MKYTIYANRKTKVAHRADKRGDACRQSAVVRGNVAKFETLAGAMAFGFRPCKRCKP